MKQRVAIVEGVYIREGHRKFIDNDGVMVTIMTTKELEDYQTTRKKNNGYS